MEFQPISQTKGPLPAIVGYTKKGDSMRNPALHMFQQLWGQELQGHPRFYELLLKAAQLHSSKNQDYGGTEQHPFEVYKRSVDIGIEPWRAALSRLSEKWARLATFARKEIYLVEEETFEDTLLDMSVIALIVLILYEEETHANEKASTPTLKTSNEPEDRGRPSGEVSKKLNTAFQSGYKEENTGQENTSVPEVSQPECSRDDGSSPRVGESTS